MKTNVKGLERVVRIVIGAAVLGQATGSYSFFEYGIVDELVGVFLLGTGGLTSCPVKSVLGLGTKKAPARPPVAKKPAAKRKPARKVAAKKPAKRKAAPKKRRAAR